MSKQTAALKLALEALERHAELGLLAGATIAAIQEALADSALERMAENARELGLNYEPPCKTGSQCTNKCQQCEQPAQQQNLQDLWHKVWPDAGAFVRASADDLTQFAKAISTSPYPAQPVAWRTFDGEGGYDYRTYDMNENYADEWNKQNPKHKGWVEPLYTSPQPAQPSKPLTDEQIIDQFKTKVDTGSLLSFADGVRFAEAAHAKGDA